MLIFFLKELRHRWVIHALAVVLLGFIVSILVVQSSLNKSAEEKIKDLSHELGKSMLVVPAGTDLQEFYSMRYGDGVMPEDVGQRIKASPLGKHVTMIEPRLFGNINVQGTDLVLVGYNPKGPVQSGNGAAIGGAAAARMGLSRGDVLQVGGQGLEILKVLDPPPKGYDMALFVPLGVAQDILGKPGSVNALYMGGCWCEMDVATFATSVEDTLPGTMAITVEGMAKAQTEMNSVMKRYTVLIWVAGALLGIGTIAFLILYLVYKGGRDIGLLLSIGMPPGIIAVKNTVVAVLVSLLGALLGYALSVPVMTWLGKTLLRIGLSPSWEYLGRFAAGSAATGLLTALVLSLYLANLDPTKLLREE